MLPMRTTTSPALASSSTTSASASPIRRTVTFAPTRGSHATVSSSKESKESKETPLSSRDSFGSTDAGRLFRRRRWRPGTASPVCTSNIHPSGISKSATESSASLVSTATRVAFATVAPLTPRSNAASTASDVRRFSRAAPLEKTSACKSLVRLSAVAACIARTCCISRSFFSATAKSARSSPATLLPSPAPCSAPLAPRLRRHRRSAASARLSSKPSPLATARALDSPETPHSKRYVGRSVFVSNSTAAFAAPGNGAACFEERSRVISSVSTPVSVSETLNTSSAFPTAIALTSS
mmetsp:Transcript_9221/g.34452  ORF Transcript_9221/g.34452 Transcript_9221/m.34452 type:complete len:296 (+) Transcript_9221:182-1069(+)